MGNSHLIRESKISIAVAGYIKIPIFNHVTIAVQPKIP